jgi:protein-S-isoprenylcysteine O-methyltransferase Ste14
MFWLCLSALLWGILHSLLASLKAKEIFARWFGESLARFYRLAYNLWAGLSFLPVLIIAFMSPARQLYEIPKPWSVLMILGEILAVVAMLAGFRQTDPWEFLGLRQLKSSASSMHPDSPVETVQGKLVKSGMYRYVRHPLYSAGIAFIWLIPSMTVNVLVINIILTVYVIIGAYFEERKLRREFGQEYTDYAAVTPMFIPFLKGNKMPG